MFLSHCLYHQLLKFRRVAFVWYSFWHSKAPHLLFSIPYCLTNGVLFKKDLRGFLSAALRGLCPPPPASFLKKVWPKTLLCPAGAGTKYALSPQIWGLRAPLCWPFSLPLRGTQGALPPTLCKLFEKSLAKNFTVSGRSRGCVRALAADSGPSGPSLLAVFPAASRHSGGSAPHPLQAF